MENEIKIEQKLGIHNRWDIEVIDAATGKVKQTARGYNVICNGWWNTFFITSSPDSRTVMCYYIAFGSGTGTPSASDTGLFHYENQKTCGIASVSLDSDKESFYGRYSIQLGTSEFNGITISEVGFRSGNNVLCTHAVLKDMNGNPISIEKTEYDIINIYGTIYCHYSMDDYFDTGVFLQFNDLYNWTSWYRYGDRRDYLIHHLIGSRLRESESDVWPVLSNILMPILSRNFVTKSLLSVPAYQLGSGEYDSITWSTSVNSSEKKCVYTAKLDVGNYNISRGIGCISPIRSAYTDSDTLMESRSGSFFALFCGREFSHCWWPGTQLAGEVIGTGDGITTKFKTAYDFPYNAIVKVNGVTASNVMVREMPSLASSASWFGLYFKSVDPYRSEDGKLYPKSGGYCSTSSNSSGLVSPAYNIIYNPFYNEIGITAAKMSYTSTGYFDLLVSNDLVNWELAIDKDATASSYMISIPSEFQHYKYWKLKSYKSGNVNDYKKCLYPDPSAYDGYNVIFDTPPAEGDVITIDYTTPYIAKDSNHVFNVSLTLSFNEYTPEE